MEEIGPIACKLALTSHIRIHNVFRVSLLQKYVYDPKHIINWENVQVELEGEFLVEPLCILDERETTLRRRVIT